MTPNRDSPTIRPVAASVPKRFARSTSACLEAHLLYRKPMRAPIGIRTVREAGR